MKSKLCIALLVTLISPFVEARVLSRKHKTEALDLSKYFNQAELRSRRPEPPSKKLPPTESLMEIASQEQSPFERNLRQVPSKRRGKKGRPESFDLEYRNTGPKSGLKIKGKRIKLGKVRSKLGRRIRKLENEVVLSQMVGGIKANAQKKHLKIKRVLLGEKVKRKFGDKHLAVHLSKLLGMGNIKGHIKAMKRKLRLQKKRLARRARKKKAAYQKLVTPAQPEEAKRKLAGMPSSGGSSKGGGKGEDNLMKFNFLPGFAGMPFPPFMMNGPHFHPPLNVTVNSLPNPNPRAELDPKEIEEENVKTQLKALNPINERLEHVLREVDSISKETEVNLEDKFQRVVQLNS